MRENELVALNMLTETFNINLKSIYKVKADNGEVYKSKANGDLYYCHVCMLKGKIRISTLQSYELDIEAGQATFLWSNEVQSYTVVGDDVQFFWTFFSLEGKKLPVMEIVKIENIEKAVKDLHHCADLLRKSSIFELARANMIFTKYVLDGVEQLASKPAESEIWQQRNIYISIDYIKENLYNLPSVQELARLVGMSLKQYRKHFKRVMGMYPAQYIGEQKMSVIKDYLSKTDLSINQIAELLGFSSPYYLCNAFKKRFGCTPSEYRKRVK